MSILERIKSGNLALASEPVEKESLLVIPNKITENKINNLNNIIVTTNILSDPISSTSATNPPFQTSTFISTTTYPITTEKETFLLFLMLFVVLLLLIIITLLSICVHQVYLFFI
jgi:hypothetical protein